MITLEISKQEAHEIRVALSCALVELEEYLPMVDNGLEEREVRARIEVIGNLIEAIPTGY